MAATLERPGLTESPLPPVHKERLRAYFDRGLKVHRIAVITGLSRQNIQYYRRVLGYPRDKPGKHALAPVLPCDLCGEATPGERFGGTPWKLEGRVCKTCRDDLVEETKARRRNEAAEWIAERRAKRAANLSRSTAVAVVPQELAPAPNSSDQPEQHERDEITARMNRVRQDNGHVPLPVLDPHFTTWDLRGKAFTHWFTGLYRSNRAIVLMREYHDKLASYAG